jgi:hypothetical protein
MFRLIYVVTVVVLAVAIALAGRDDEISILPAEHPAIQYADARLEDPVARLDRRLQSGQAKLDFDPNGTGYLPSILKNLGINVDSQALVFSKTSFQAAKISPRAPRAIFFNDEVEIGSVQSGDVLEFASLDPKQGVIFYTLDARKSDKPRFDRRDACLQCHQGPATLGVPGIMIASVYADATGMPSFRLGLPVTDHRTRFQDRWGGWYVSGTHGGMRHKGNAVARDAQKPDLLETQGTQNLTSLARKFDASRYLSGASDIVALLTLEHQTRMTNLMTRAGWAWRIAEHEGKLADPVTRARIDGDIESLAAYMLFADEAQLYDTVQGVSTFTRTFAERGPRDRKGRSLREFDLDKRLFRYPLSYMVYSEAFDSLPPAAREIVLRRVYDVLTGKNPDQKFARVSSEDRIAILEILRDTKPNLPAYWRTTN